MMTQCDGKVVISKDINPELFNVISNIKQPILNKIMWFLFPKYMRNIFFKNIEIKRPS